MMSQLEKKYQEQVKKSLFEQFKFKSPMQIPSIEKIVINMTAGNQVTNSKIIEEVCWGNWKNFWTKTNWNKSKKIPCFLKTKRRDANGFQGDFKKTKNVVFF